MSVAPADGYCTRGQGSAPPGMFLAVVIGSISLYMAHRSAPSPVGEPSGVVFSAKASMNVRIFFSVVVTSA